MSIPRLIRSACIINSTLPPVIPAPRTLLRGIRKLAPTTPTLTLDAYGRRRWPGLTGDCGHSVRTRTQRGGMDRSGA